MSRVTEQYQEACKYLAGGVSASTRLNRAVGHSMLFDRAEGCRVWDLDGREYIDLCCSHGATLLGHGDSHVRRAVEQVMARGAACSYENELHTELARLLCETIPCCERVRFTGSGSEATMHCLRLARASTGRTRLLKFEGNFHGYHDQVMYAIGTPADRLGPETSPTAWPGSTGMPAALAAVTASREPGFYEHIHAVARELYEGLNDVFARHGVAGHVQGLGARFGVYFGLPGKAASYRDAVRHQRDTMLRFVAAAIRHGVYFHDYGGAACHHGFCAAMTLADVREALQRLDPAVGELGRPA